MSILKNRKEQNEYIYKILSVAAVSSVPIYSVIVINKRGKYMTRETYEHAIETIDE